MQERDGGGRSPVFIQFLDCVHQLWHQMPSQFEFNADLLLFLAESLYSCKYGNWLFNSDLERQQQRVRENTISIWMEVGLRRQSDFSNPYYQHHHPHKKAHRITQIPVT